jgi:hypothetical protein
MADSLVGEPKITVENVPYLASNEGYQATS